MVQGPGPSARYAHTLALVANRFLVAMGGNDGKQTLGDAWALDTSDKPYQWRKITDAGEPPVARCETFAACCNLMSRQTALVTVGTSLVGTSATVINAARNNGCAVSFLVAKAA
jgi:hypothetical protein